MNPAEVAANSRAAPVIVMAYAGYGADQLRSALSVFPGLTCTSATGILPLCHSAVTAWQKIDGSAGNGLSPPAAASVKTFTAGLMTAILARYGGARWCEFTSAPPAAASTFARLYPQTLFLTVHRQADIVIRAILNGSRWGLAGPEFAPFVSASPESSVAALASYWATHTARLLEFERAHRGTCLRVRIEDVRETPKQALLDIGDFLSCHAIDVDAQPAEPPLSAPGLPLNQIPSALLSQLSDLHDALGYAAVK